MFSIANLKTGVLCFIFHNCIPGLVNEQTQQRGNEEEIHNFFYCDLEQEQKVIQRPIVDYWKFFTEIFICKTVKVTPVSQED